MVRPRPVDEVKHPSTARPPQPPARNTRAVGSPADIGRSVDAPGVNSQGTEQEAITDSARGPVFSRQARPSASQTPTAVASGDMKRSGNSSRKRSIPGAMDSSPRHGVKKRVMLQGDRSHKSCLSVAGGRRPEGPGECAARGADDGIDLQW